MSMNEIVKKYWDIQKFLQAKLKNSWGADSIIIEQVASNKSSLLLKIQK